MVATGSLRDESAPCADLWPVEQSSAARQSQNRRARRSAPDPNAHRAMAEAEPIEQLMLSAVRRY
jgi:hypothetical protein